MHFVITTQEDPQLPIARLRVRDQLTELRAANFRNTKVAKTPPKPVWNQDDFTPWVKESSSGSGQTRIFGYATDPAFFAYCANFAFANGTKVIGDYNKCTIKSSAGVSSPDWLFGLKRDMYLTLPSGTQDMPLIPVTLWRGTEP